jgi:hypothetical protein
VSLRAPIAVPVQISLDLGLDARRVFRLGWNVGEDGIRLAGRLPFETGRQVAVRFGLPGGEGLTLRAHIAAGGVDDDEDAEAQGELLFVDPPTDARVALHRYVRERLELPS